MFDRNVNESFTANNQSKHTGNGRGKSPCSYSIHQCHQQASTKRRPINCERKQATDKQKIVRLQSSGVKFGRGRLNVVVFIVVVVVVYVDIDFNNSRRPRRQGARLLLHKLVPVQA